MNLPHTPNPPKDTKEKILWAAMEIFSNKGYASATTREIAALANVNEVTLFRHFGTKENLFKAVLDKYADPPGLSKKFIDMTTGDYAEDLKRIALLFLQVILQREESIRLLLCESQHFPELSEIMANNPRVLREGLNKYLEMQQKKGQIKPDMDINVLSQMFYGMIFAYGVTHNILSDPAVPEMEPEELVSQMVNVFVYGTSIPKGSEK